MNVDTTRDNYCKFTADTSGSYCTTNAVIVGYDVLVVVLVATMLLGVTIGYFMTKWTLLTTKLNEK